MDIKNYTDSIDYDNLKTVLNFYRFRKKPEGLDQKQQKEFSHILDYQDIEYIMQQNKEDIIKDIDNLSLFYLNHLGYHNPKYEEYLKEATVSKYPWLGVQYIYSFDNGYGASIIKRSFSYGWAQDLFEMALLDKFGIITYEHDFKDDVIGYLSYQEVDKLLDKISKY